MAAYRYFVCVVALDQHRAQRLGLPGKMAFRIRNEEHVDGADRIGGLRRRKRPLLIRALSYLRFAAAPFLFGALPSFGLSPLLLFIGALLRFAFLPEPFLVCSLLSFGVLSPLYLLR